MRLLGVPSLRWLPVGLALLLAVEERLTGAAYTGDHNAVALAAAAGSLFLTLVALSRWLTVSKRAAAVGLVALTVTAPGLLSGDLKEAARFALTALLLVSAHALVASSAAERARPLVAWLARVLVVVGFA